MIRLRPYKTGDAKYILNWIKDEKTFVLWCAYKFNYPLTVQQLKEYKDKYDNDNSGWPMTALNEEGIPVGHLLMLNVDYKNKSVHFGFVIVDSEIRNKGYGKEMMEAAVKYVFEILKLSRITLHVYANNPIAHTCYKSVGFVDEKYIENTIQYKDENWSAYAMAAEKNNLNISAFKE
jgi:RimJ/RimL family protein N-acetyltransferase